MVTQRKTQSVRAKKGGEQLLILLSYSLCVPAGHQKQTTLTFIISKVILLVIQLLHINFFFPLQKDGVLTWPFKIDRYISQVLHRNTISRVWIDRQTDRLIYVKEMANLIVDVQVLNVQCRLAGVPGTLHNIWSCPKCP